MLELRPFIRHSIVVACVTAIAGCAAPQPNQKENKPQPNANKVAQMLDPDVVAIGAFYDPYDPWLWNETRSKPIGVVIRALYLQGPNYKGVFGDGTIRPKLFVSERNEKGEKDWTLVKEWSFNVEEAIRYRSRRQTLLGWGYRFDLPWGDLNMNLAGREVRLIVEFERSDGRTLVTDTKDFRMPGEDNSPRNAQGTSR